MPAPMHPVDYVIDDAGEDAGLLGWHSPGDCVSHSGTGADAGLLVQHLLRVYFSPAQVQTLGCWGNTSLGLIFPLHR